MLSKVQIRGYQPHKRLDVTFDPVTTIIGSTDTGKSSFIGSLIWMLTNSPSGLEFINDTMDMARMKMIIDDHVVIRRKSKGVNIYRLDDKRYPSLVHGKEIPEPIANLFNVCDMNFQLQHDAPFWLSKTAGMVSRELNKLINLEIMDITLANLDSRLQKTRERKALEASHLQELTEQIEQGQFYLDLDAELSRLETLEKRHMRISQKRSVLADLIERAIICRTRAENSSERHIEAMSVLEKGRRYHKIHRKLRKLRKLRKQAARSKKKIDNKPPDISSTERHFAEWLDAKVAVKKITDCIRMHKEATKSQTDYRNQAAKAETILKKKIGKVCPLCGNPTKAK
jgi:hypothetical protein